MMPLTQLVKRLFVREVLILTRQIGLVFNSTFIFLMIIIFFPLTMPPDSTLLNQLAPGLVWIALLLSTLMSSERLFGHDFEDGVVEQWMVSGQPLAVLVTIKLIAHWLFAVIPLVILSPLIAFVFDLSWHVLRVVVLSILFGSPAMFFLCALTAVFSGGLRQKGLYMTLVLMPLTLPIMIFGSGAITVAMQGMPVSGYLALLAAMSLLSLALLPFAIAAMMRISLVD
jgi:heme exporter protein B